MRQLLFLFSFVLLTALQETAATVGGHGEVEHLFNATSIKADPLEHYVSLYAGLIKKNSSYLMVAKFDLNQDGLDDVLVSDGSNRSAYFVNRWTIYLLRDDGYEHLSAQIAFDPGCFGIQVVESLGREAIISCTPTAAGSAKAFASYIDEEKGKIVEYYRIHPPKGVDLKSFYKGIVGYFPKSYKEIEIRYLGFDRLVEKFPNKFKADN